MLPFMYHLKYSKKCYIARMREGEVGRKGELGKSVEAPNRQTVYQFRIAITFEEVRGRC